MIDFLQDVKETVIAKSDEDVLTLTQGVTMNGNSIKVIIKYKNKKIYVDRMFKNNTNGIEKMNEYIESINTEDKFLKSVGM